MNEGARKAVIIEDDADIRFLLESTLRQAGFAVHSVTNGTAGVDAVREHDPLVTTLDISLPDIDGFEVARRIRTFSSTYILMLTGRSDEIDTLLGLEAGADDYVTKPFRPREVRARIEAMLRRPRAVVGAGSPDPAAEIGTAEDSDTARTAEAARAAGTPGTARNAGTPEQAQVRGSASVPDGATSDAAARGDAGPPSGEHPMADLEGVYRHQNLVVDVESRLTSVDGAGVHLTRSEFDILAAIVSAGRRVVSKDRLVRAVWGDEDDFAATVTDADRRAVEVHIGNLRRKLGDAASAPRFIETVRGVGYRLTVAR